MIVKRMKNMTRIMFRRGFSWLGQNETQKWRGAGKISISIVSILFEIKQKVEINLSCVFATEVGIYETHLG